ncbi:addiction module toxin RelE [Bacillus sp. VT-16-64]|nr:addiction module toxin RelE [Bacillus sp. VT-16-64]
MAYQIVYTKKAIKSLSKIDPAQQRMIIAWIEKNLINTENPKSLGKNLKGNLKEYWRYRVGNYRILADINNDEVKIIIFNIGHRKDIYS